MLRAGETEPVTAEQRDGGGNLAVSLGLGANVVLAALKTAFGVLGHSPALLADGVNSTSDVAYYVVVAIFMRLAARPADEEHPYGHRQLESIAALVVGVFVISTAIAIFWDSINSVYDLLSGVSQSSGAAPVALWVALLTVATKLVLTSVTRGIGRRTGNAAVLALAYDHRNDIFSASGAAVGIVLGRMGYAWVDPLAGALVALIVLRTGVEVLRQSSDDLMDTLPGKSLNDQIRRIAAGVKGVRQVEEIAAHRFGPYLVINLTLGVDGDLPVREGDAIATRVERALLDQVELARRVRVHYHPDSATSERHRLSRAGGQGRMAP